MSEIIVIGGGLTSLSAAFELEKQGLDYTLIEVKGRLGGNIVSERRSGFVLDGGPFILRRSRPWPLLAELGLDDAVYQVAALPDGAEQVAFKAGTHTVIDALSQRLKRGRIITRMAVSTLGQIDQQFAVCLENGMVMNASALIVTAPARHAERMFYTFQPEISQRLLNHHYDQITRVSLGFRRGEIEPPRIGPPDVGYAFGRWTDSEHRAPPDHLLIQVGLRYPLPQSTPEALIAEVLRVMRWPQPVVSRVDYWPESHSLMHYSSDHMANIAGIEALLPSGVALAGSDYRASRFEDRMLHGQEAAKKIAADLQHKARRG